MNLDLTWGLHAFSWWIRLTLLELDIDKLWGFSFGLMRISLNKYDGAELERSLLYINKTKYMTRFDFLFIRLIEKYK